MIERYQILFSIELLHNFYGGGRSPDFSIEPTTECWKTLRRHRLLWKECDSDSSADVIVELINTGTDAAPVFARPVAIKPDTTFTFLLRMRNPQFCLNITECDQRDFGDGRRYLFSNAPGALETTDGTVRRVDVQNGIPAHAPTILTRLFTWRADPVGNPATAALRNLAGQELFREPAQLDGITFAMDARGFPEGEYELVISRASGALLSSEPVFLTDEPTARDCFGLVQIHYTQDILNDPENRHRFQLAFDARLTRWIYVVNVEEVEPAHPDNLDAAQLALSNAPVGFTRAVSAGPPKRTIFTSNVPIALRQEPRSGILLKSGPGPNDRVLVDHMPNPGVEQLVKDGPVALRSEMFVTVR